MIQEDFKKYPGFEIIKINDVITVHRVTTQYDVQLFERPQNNIKIWRYLDTAKLASLLDTKSLYFARADQLQKSDIFEGSYSDQYCKYIVEALRDPVNGDKQGREMLEKSKQWSRFVWLNCWYMSEYENVAMWDLYSKKQFVIQSTYARLEQSLKDCGHNLQIGKIHYIDVRSSPMYAPGYVQSPFMHKRMEYENECELRALILKFPIKESKLNFSLEFFPRGIDARVEPESLIEKIYKHPQVETSALDRIMKVISKHQYGIRVEKSALETSPGY